MVKPGVCRDVLDKIIAPLAALIVATISTLGYLGIVVLMAIESACIPLPSEIIMPFSGYLVFTGRFDLVWVATAGAIGCNVGSTVAYVVGYYGGRPLVEKWGAYVLMSRQDLALVERFFARFGSITVFVSRLLPVVRTFIALPAGVARMPQVKFQIYTFLGSWPWCFALAYVGMRLGERWDTDPALRDFMHRFDAVIVGALVVAVIWYVRRHWRHRMTSNGR
jgi:membrane protein DedA with SNARE-associated domain